MPSVDIGSFRIAFPEFSDLNRYPDSLVTFWFNFCSAMVNPRVWCNQYPVGVYLYMAHQITLAAQNVTVAATGGSPGTTVGGAVASKTVGGASVGYDTSSSAEAGAGVFNQTTYGRMYWDLLMTFGARPLQL